MINQEQINALIATEIRKLNLNDVLKLDAVKEKVMQKLKQTTQKNEDEIVNEMELPVVSSGPVQFPKPDEDQNETQFTNDKDQDQQFKVAPDVINQVDPFAPKAGMESGSQPLNTPIEPKIAIVPEIPDFLKDVEPAKIFVYDFNELSVGGENLSAKPFKTLDNPEISKSMQQMWSENGVTKAEVYQTKFEKIGEVVYDYKSGASQFIEKGANPDFVAQQQYKENPYAAEPQKEIETYIKNNVDLEKMVNDVVTNIVKNYFLMLLFK